MSKNLFTPNVLTINILVTGAMKQTPQELTDLLSPLGAILNVSSTPMVFDGTALVPAPAEAPAAVEAISPAPKPNKEKARKAQAAQATKRAKDNKADEPKPITLAEGSNPERIYSLIRSGPALTSTQIREKLKLDSNVVNTTVYRLKGAGMIRPMSHNAPNGDTLYTSTEWDAKTAAEVTNGDE